MRITSDAVLFKLVTNCAITCTLVIIRLASWCNRSAAATARSRPMCSNQYSGDRPRRRADSGAPYIPSYGGHEGVFRKPGPNRRGCLGRHMMSCGIDIPACCSRPGGTGLGRVRPRSRQKVPPLSNPDRCPDHLDTSRMRGTRLSLPPRTPWLVGRQHHFSQVQVETVAQVE